MPEQVAPDKTIFELLHETSKIITSEVELEKIVQRVTDLGTELVGAQFGAFFYNVINANGESFFLYTISGVPREHFSKFPMPRNTKIFSPTFEGTGTVRYNDVTTEKHYGQNPPYHGMPKGHLPVKSYLATPVISPITKEVIGGLFFGHSEPGIFKENTEKLIEGVATQAAIAMGNARLFDEKTKTEKNLIEQKDQYLSIFNATSDSIIIYNSEGIISEVNPAACKTLGYHYDELKGQHGSKLYEDAAQFEAVKEFALSGRQYSGTGTRVKKDGGLLNVNFTGSHFIFKGQPHVLSVFKDITHNKQTEEALQKSEDLSHLISTVSPVTLLITNIAGEVIYINKTWTDWVGNSSEDNLGSGWLAAITLQHKERIGEEVKRAVQDQKFIITDFEIKRRSGETRWCAAQIGPYYDRFGKFAGLAGSITDITERKMAEQKLESQNVLVSTITNNTLQAMFLMNDKSICTYMNPAAEKMIGFKLEEIQEKPLHYYIHHTHPDGRHFPIEECAIDRALPTKNQTQGEEVFIHRNGTFFPVSFIASPIIENGIPTGTVIEVRDITEEKRIQKELQKKELVAKTLLEEKVKERTAELEKSNYELLQFTSVASHDLKEPLRKISIFSKMLNEKIKPFLNEETERYLNSIIKSSSRMTSLIDDLLNFSRLSQTNIVFEKLDLNHLLKLILDDLEISIKEKNATIIIDDLPTIDGNTLQLGQVFQNLISNSLKFVHKDRHPHIVIRAVEDIKNNSCKIIYSDNGIGFEDKQAERIFEIFHRLHTKEQYEGTGVGLAIVKKIISIHKGKIKAIGRKDEGAIFEITLPIKQQEFILENS